MSIIKIEDIAFVRFTAPDLDPMRGFLADFGLVAVEPAMADMLYARGVGTAPFLHVTTLGEPGFAGLGLRAQSVVDLQLLAAAEGAAVEASAAPGGGSVVRLRDPDDNLVEVVAGQTLSEPLPLKPTTATNTITGRPRARELKRLTPGPSQVVRLGHAVLNVANFRASEQWYKDRFGFITSDEIALTPEFSLGSFLRCDRGETPTDHHTLFLLQAPEAPGFNHAAFEVADLDDLMTGHDLLKSAQCTPHWGIGRHLLGSQIFDYWRDPWGNTLEHWTDGDLLTAADGSQVSTVQDLMAVQWGSPMPTDH